MTEPVTWAAVGMELITISPVLSILLFLKSGLKPLAQKIAATAAIRIITAIAILKIVLCLASGFIIGSN